MSFMFVMLSLAYICCVSPRLLLQLTTEAHAAETSMAFGCSLKNCRHLLEMARDLGVQVVGVTFHIPPSCQELQQAYTHALSDARAVFDMGVSTANLNCAGREYTLTVEFTTDML